MGVEVPVAYAHARESGHKVKVVATFGALTADCTECDVLRATSEPAP